MRKLLLASALTAMASLVLSAPADAQRRGGGGGGQPQGYAGPPFGANGLPGGTWTTVCRNGFMSGDTLNAECKDAVGQYHATSMSLQNCQGDIGDQNGVLACHNGVKGTAGPALPNQSAQYDRRDDRRNDRRNDREDRSNDRAAAAVAGAVVGALLGPPPPPPPGVVVVPGRDWRYERGGWGYGHRPGEWVPIRDRANWIDDRIDRARRDGRLDRRDVRQLRRELDDIVEQERRYDRDGRLGPRERDDLQRRFDDLERRIDYRTRR